MSTDDNLYSIMMVKKISKNEPYEIEFLIVYENESPGTETKDIDLARQKWMGLCGAHNSNELVSEMYTSDAYYFNRGRLLQGTNEIAVEYSYMNNPSYSLKLTPKYLEMVSDRIAFEIGQCSGSYPLPYMILWEKQSNGNWMVLFDSNY